MKNPGDYGLYESQVVQNTKRILKLLDAYSVNATFFVVGKVAQRHPEIVSKICQAGHELASHGYVHQTVSSLGRKGFIRDAQKSKVLLEKLSGQEVIGYRAMAFSVNDSSQWVYKALGDLGYNYDSSVFSTNMSRALWSAAEISGVREIPVSSLAIASRDVTIGGGLLFRLAPWRVIDRLAESENRMGRRFLVYLHAWEFNKDQPARNVGLLQRFSQSPLFYNGPKNLERLLECKSFTSIRKVLMTEKMS